MTQTLISTHATKLDAQNPWPGLAAYDEASSAFFFGRAEESEHLRQLIRAAPVTVIYGKSGLGKTSLLQAGLFPLLRAEHYLPVYVRLDFSDVDKEEPLGQVMWRLTAELDSAGAEYPTPEEHESLWEYLHRKDLEFWSSGNFLLTPVLVLDQFEELFSRSSGNPELIAQICDGLADLIENRIPTDVAGDSSRSRRSRLDLLSQRYRVVISFREDFLPDIRTWEHKVPSLLRHYLRLDPMSRLRAIDAVEHAGNAVLEEGVAQYIVDFVGRLDRMTDPVDPSSVIIEPVLLSLCCYQLNRQRARDGKIDQGLVDNTGEDILDSFYREALEDPELKAPPDVAVFIEDYLIQGDHFRGDYPKQEALNEHKLTERQLAILTDKHRLLRVVHRTDTARVELIHDRLVPIVRRARDERRIMQHQREQERLAREAQEERDRERARLKAARRSRNIAVAAAIISLIVIAWGSLQWNQAIFQRNRAESMKLTSGVAVDTSRLAEGRLALGVGWGPLEQTIYRGLAAYRLTQADASSPQDFIQGMSKARAASLTTLHYVLEQTGHLRKAVSIRGLVPTPALSYSPDGKILAVGGEDGRILLMDAETYRESTILDCGKAASAQSVWSLAFNRDGTRLAAGYIKQGKEPGSGLVCVLDVQKHSVTRSWSSREISGHDGAVYSIAFSNNTGLDVVVSGGSDIAPDKGERGVLRVWDLETDVVHEVFSPQDVVAVAVSPDGQRVVSGGDDKIIRVWNLAEIGTARQKPTTELHGHVATIQQVMFSPGDPDLLLSTGDDGRIMVWNLKGAGCRTQQSKLQPVRLYGVTVNADGIIASAGVDGDVRLFRISESAKACVADKALPELDVIPDGTLSGHGGSVLAVAFSPDGNRLASSGQDGSIRIWGPKTGGFSLAQLTLAANVRVTAVAISPDNRSIAAGDEGGGIHLWDAPAANSEPVTQLETATWTAHSGGVRSLAYARVGDRLVLISGGDDSKIREWDTATRHLFNNRILNGDKPIRSIAVSPDNKLVAGGSPDGTVRLWSIGTGESTATFDKPKDSNDYELYAIAFTHDGRHVAVGSNYDDVRLVDHEKTNSERTLGGHNKPVTGLAQGGARWLLSAGEDGSVLEWDPAALKQPQTQGLKRQDGFTFRMGFRDLKPLKALDTSADGTLIVAGGKDGLVQLWDGSEHVLIGSRFLGHEQNDIQAVALASDGSFFVTADRSKILVWPGPVQWADIICAKLVWNMSHETWREWVSPAIPYKEQCPGLPTLDDGASGKQTKRP
jgi:WD40 repeat protein